MMLRKINRAYLFKNIHMDSTTGCWLWQKALTWNGYGRVKLQGKTQRVHRVVYRTFVGPIPKGMLVLHKCDVPACCNPDHLFLGTHADNSKDMRDKGRSPQGAHNIKAKLTDNKVIVLRRLWATGKFTRKQLTFHYGMSKSQVNKILRRVQWAHVL